MRKLYFLLIILIAFATSGSYGANAREFPGYSDNEVLREFVKFYVISDCTELPDNVFPYDCTENTTISARNFYPANSLNVLKKAFYAFYAPQSNIPSYSEAC